MHIRLPLLLMAAMAMSQQGARAIVLFGTGDPDANTTPPAGVLAGSGWQTQTDRLPGATAISRNSLLTAVHIATPVGDHIHFDGLTYWVQRTADAPGSDLRLLEVAGRMDSNRIAGIFPDSSEVGRGAVVHGFGRQRGAPVFLDDSTGTRLRGWLWGASGERLRWGTNVITQTNSGDVTGDFILAAFTADAGRDEAAVSIGDSGGGVFLRDADGRWKLAGVMYDVEGYFKNTAEGPAFFASIFDRRGFFEQNARGQWVQLPESGIEPGTVWQATRVSSYRDWIAGESSKPQTTPWPRLYSAPSPSGPFSEHRAYAVNPKTRQVTFKSDAQQRFFHLGDSAEVRSVRSTSGIVELSY